MEVKAVRQTSLKEFLRSRGIPSKKLNQPCQDNRLCEVALHVTSWLTLAPFLGISEAEEKEIVGNWPRDVAKQKIDFFRKWREKCGQKATYQKLCKAIVKMGDVALAEKVCDIVTSSDSSSSESSDDENSGLSAKSSEDKPSNLSHSPAVKQYPSEVRHSPLSWQHTGPPASSDNSAPESETSKQSDHPISLPPKPVDNVKSSSRSPCLLPPKLQPRKEVGVSSSTHVSSTQPPGGTSPPPHPANAPTTASNAVLNTESKSWDSKLSVAAHSQPKSRELPQSNQPPPLPPKPAKPGHKVKVSVPDSSLPPTPPPRPKKPAQGRLVLYPPRPPAGEDYPPNPYVEYLRDMYGRKPPQFLDLQWPPPPTRQVFNLAIIHKKAIQYGSVDEELVRLLQRGNVVKERTSVRLQDIFRLDGEKRKIILIEGAPGSGKSTLAWHVCQKWKARELFQEFRLVVFVQLRDPRVQSAQSIADLLPAGSEEKRRAAAEGIRIWEGRGVLFILDGWDEFEPGLKADSVVSRLICKSDELDVPYSTLLITSRPIASAPIQPLASSRVDIVGFTPEEVRQYFQEVVTDPVALQALQEQLKELPVIEASCYLPLNAAIVAHLFMALDYTPRTLHGVFSALVCGCIISHLNKQSGKIGCVPKIPSLDQLPQEVQPPFTSLCLLAYEASMKNKATFSSEDLLSYGVSVEGNGLGLMQGVRSFLSGKSDSYYFLHLSVQELLAAVHVSKLGAGEQVSIFRELFSKPRLVAMFRFFAALTKLKTEGVREVIANVIKRGTSDASKVQWREYILNILHCLYEAQDSSLCLLVASLLSNVLHLGKISLSPLDCLCVGYFVRCVSICRKEKFKLYLASCGVDSYRFHCIAKELGRSVHSGDEASSNDVATGGIDLTLARNYDLDGSGTRLIGEFIARNPQVLGWLDLSYNKIQDPHQDGLLSLLRVLRNNPGIACLTLTDCHLRINDENGPVLVEMLHRNKTLRELNIGGNRELGDTGLRYIVEGMTKNSGVAGLELWWCGLGEEGGRLLGRMLKENRTLKFLRLDGNNGLDDVGIAELGMGLKANSGLRELIISQCAYSLSGLKKLLLNVKGNEHLRKLRVNTVEEVKALVQEKAAVNHIRRSSGQKDLQLHTLV